jgi:PAS domain S-box-containing protein
MPLDQRFLRVVDRFLALVKEETGFDGIVCDETGIVVRSTASERVGHRHPGAHKVVRYEEDEYLVSAAEAAENPAAREGMSCSIVVGGRRVGIFGLDGKEETTRPLARLASVLLSNWLSALEREAAPQSAAPDSSRRARVLWIHPPSSSWLGSAEGLRGRYDLVEAGDFAQGIALARAEVPDVVLCDRDDEDASWLAGEMKADRALRAVPLVVLGEAAERHAARGCAVDVTAPSCFGSAYLEALVDSAVRISRMKDDLRAEQESLGRMIMHAAQSEARLRAVVESALDGIVLLGPEHRIEGMNAAAERIFGFAQSEAAGRDFVDTFVAPGSRAAVIEALNRRRHATAHRAAMFGGLHRNGHEFPMECGLTRLETGSGAGRCAFVRDLTEFQRMQVELHQAQKLEAVGQLAAGIAHEINTPIQYIGDNTQFLQEAFGALSTFTELTGRHAEALPPEVRDELRSAEEQLDLAYLREEVPGTIARTLQGVQRVATIVRAMKEFAHPDQREMVATDLNRSIQATLEVARNEYKYVAEVETDLSELPLVTCHAGDLNQVFLNIIVNAAHAVGDVVKGTQDRGRIRVASRREGSDVVVSISDTGTGIPEEVRAKVYDPFFTTKGVGRGTGQGLAIARSIVGKHNGSIHFETEQGKGTTFFIRLPVEGAASGGAE